MSTPIEEQLREANKLIKFSVEKGTFTNSEKIYYNKHLKPIDPLRDAVIDIMEFVTCHHYDTCEELDIDRVLDFVKTRLKDELGPKTAGLDEIVTNMIVSKNLILEKMMENRALPVIEQLLGRVLEIKERLEAN